MTKLSDGTLYLIHCGLEIPSEITIWRMDEELASNGWEGDFSSAPEWKAREIRRLRGGPNPDVV